MNWTKWHKRTENGTVATAKTPAVAEKSPRFTFRAHVESPVTVMVRGMLVFVRQPDDEQGPYWCPIAYLYEDRPN